MEYYIYISRTKVEMMYEQLSGEDSRSSSIKAKIGLPQLAEIESQVGTSKEITLYQKLNKVIKYLERRKEIGTIQDSLLQENLQYIQDAGAWKNVLLSKSYDIQSIESPMNYVLFCSRPSILVFLVGSPKHILGASEQVYAGTVSPSWTVDELIMNYVKKDLRLDDKFSPKEKYLPGLFGFMAHIWQVPNKNLKVLFRIYGWHKISAELWAEAINHCLDYFNRAEIRDDLLSQPEIALVGSPIYVALG